MSRFADRMRAAFGGARLMHEVALAPFTTFRIGGPAEWLFEPRAADEIVSALRIAREERVPVTLLGGGSNVLISDTGVRGLVVRPRAGVVARVDGAHVRADAAATMNGLVRWTIAHGCAGLEAWAGTPGSVGGAVFGNAHFAGRQIGDLVTEVRLASRDGSVIDVPAGAMAFAYDRSRLQESGEVLLWAVFRVSPGDPAALRAIARESLAYRKRTQPLASPSAGCIFQNPDPAHDRLPAGVPWSAGALIDLAGMKGVVVGGARVSPAHGNFIVNDRAATARDLRRLIERCREAVRAKFGVELRDEIVYLGEFNEL